MGIVAALLAALLFGVSTPLGKLLVANVQPMMLAGLLYAGSGVGLFLAMVVRLAVSGPRRVVISRPGGTDLAWLAGAIVVGGIVAPVLLMLGLVASSASAASLLLNFEGVFTALIAWFVFKENFDRRIALGMALIVAGGVALAWAPDGTINVPLGAALVAAACLCWAVDNNLTRKVAGNDAMAIACLKGLAAGTINIGIASAAGASFPAVGLIGLALLVGFIGYGVSLVLFVLALRALGAARTGAYFALAPFFGVAAAIPLTGEPVTAQLAVAAALMGAGAWLHVTEHHAHRHVHEEMEHEHVHMHDAHHQHGHAHEVDPRTPHSHAHTHKPLVHSHPHYPDIHHQHRH